MNGALDDHLTDVDSELFEASEELRSCTGLGGRTESGSPTSPHEAHQMKLDMLDRRDSICSKVFGDGLDRRASEGDQGSVSSAGLRR